jgi:enoyl-CoA hydratase
MDLSRSENITLEQSGDTLIVRFTRPEIRNPLSVKVLKELDEILNHAAKFERIIFTGTGDAFASGANLNEIGSLRLESDVRLFALRGQALMQKIADAPQQTIAAVNGFCFGGALDLALACDTRIALPDALFCHPGVGLGIMTGWGGTQRLPRLIGEAAALEMFLTAKRVDAEEALRIGLIDRIGDLPI